MKDGNTIHDDGYHDLVHWPPLNNLIIHNVSETHSGWYQCKKRCHFRTSRINYLVLVGGKFNKYIYYSLRTLFIRAAII